MQGLSEIKALNRNPAGNPAGDERSTGASNFKQREANKAEWLRRAKEAELKAGDQTVPNKERAAASRLASNLYLQAEAA